MIVVAFVGPPGHGKSHRAAHVAYQSGCSLIIDDGLLIEDGRILAGSSAKREDSKVGAVKRAIFSDPAHAEEVRDVLHDRLSASILILGTSDDMICRICKALGLPGPEQTVRIEDVATPAQMRLARRKRMKGQHVIPAMTLEVKRTFSGYMVDPLRFLLKRSEEDEVMESSIVRPTFSSFGRLTIADTVVASIATHAAESIPGLFAVDRAVVEITPEGVVMELEVAIQFGQYIYDVLQHTQQTVFERVEQMTALTVHRVAIIARRVVRS